MCFSYIFLCIPILTSKATEPQAEAKNSELPGLPSSSAIGQLCHHPSLRAGFQTFKMRWLEVKSVKDIF